MCLQQGGGDTLVARRSRCIFLLFFSYLCCCWATGVSPLLELLLLLLFLLFKVAKCVCNKELCLFNSFFAYDFQLNMNSPFYLYVV